MSREQAEHWPQERPIRRLRWRTVDQGSQRGREQGIRKAFERWSRQASVLSNMTAGVRGVF